MNPVSVGATATRFKPLVVVVTDCDGSMTDYFLSVIAKPIVLQGLPGLMTGSDRLFDLLGNGKNKDFKKVTEILNKSLFRTHSRYVGNTRHNLSFSTICHSSPHHEHQWLEGCQL